MKKILYVTSFDANSRKAWSGICFSIYQELKKYYDVDNLVVASPVKSSISKIINMADRIITGKRDLYSHSLKRAEKSSKLLEEALRIKKYDAVFAIDSSCMAYTDTSVPIVYYSDGVVSSMFDYYWFNVSKKAKEEANFVQKNALLKSTAVILTSKWAKDAAVRDYGIKADKIRVIRSGANIENDGLKTISDHQGVINLLFCGVDWKRKGGDYAVETLRYLTKIDKSRKYILHMYGCNPPYEIKDKNIKLYGFLNRDIPAQKKIFEELWAKADFFLSPLKADCAAVSFCEACAHAVPSITYDTGGVADHIINDYNGFRLPMGSGPEEFAKKIIELSNDNETLRELKKNARQYYETELNWAVAGKKIYDVIEESISN